MEILDDVLGRNAVLRRAEELGVFESETIHSALNTSGYGCILRASRLRMVSRVFANGPRSSASFTKPTVVID